METILQQLQTLGSFALYGWSHAPADNYGVVSQDGQNALRGSNALAEKVQEGTVDWFSRSPTSTMPGSIESALDSLGASWYLNSVQYENDTGFIHWEWVWQYG